jgi:putative ABC transport system permease protein
VGIILPPIVSSVAVWARSLGLMVLIGVVVGALPAYRGLRLRVVDALAGR